MVDTANSDDEIGRVNASLHFYLIIGSVTFPNDNFSTHPLSINYLPNHKKISMSMLHSPGVKAHPCIGIDFAPYNNLCKFLNKNLWPSLLLTRTSCYVKNSI